MDDRILFSFSQLIEYVTSLYDRGSTGESITKRRSGDIVELRSAINIYLFSRTDYLEDKEDLAFNIIEKYYS